MIELNEIKNFDLLPFSNNKSSSNKFNSINQNVLIDVEKEILRVVKSCEAILIHECEEIKDFKGRDVDSFYISKEKLLKLDEKDLILHQREEGSFRFLLNHKKTIGFINIDIEDVNIFFNKKKFNKEKFNSAAECKKTGLKHYDLKTLIFYKIIKYFSFGVIHSYEQLFKLKNILNKLNKDDLQYILNLTSKYLKSEHKWIKFLIVSDFLTYENDQSVKKFWINKRKIRQSKRKVYAGKLNLKNLFKTKKFLYAFFFGKSAKWNLDHKPLPAIAIIGNDGSGKTTSINHIIKNFSKMDPAHISMRPDTPLIPLVRVFRKVLKKIINFSIIRNFYPLKFFLSLIGQSVDLFDRYLKYKVGMAWADSGYGITIFERYITDKIRGEFPNKKNRFLPLEQFFPFPDGFIYLDVSPEVSIKRKINEDHTLEEMISKRKNYLSLLSEFSETINISSDRKFEETIKDIKNYIFDLSVKKRERLKTGAKIKRCIWSKNLNRVLVGEKTKRFQKDSFI